MMAGRLFPRRPSALGGASGRRRPEAPASSGATDSSEDEAAPAAAAGPNDLLPADAARYLEVRRSLGEEGWERCFQGFESEPKA